MRGVWVDAENDPTYERYRPRGITVPFFDPRDQRVTAPYLDAVLAHDEVEQCGIYTAWNWLPEFSSPARYAEWTHEQLLRIAWQGNAWVILDIEEHDAGYVVSVLQRWRQLRPTRSTWWTLEGFQGGLFLSAQVAAVVASKVRIAPQFYAGGMAPLEHGVVIDLLAYGFPGERIDGMYDAARLPGAAWRGIAYTQGRLP